MKRYFLTFLLLFGVFVLAYLFSASESVYACSGTFQQPSTPCEPAICGVSSVSGVWQRYVDYSNVSDFHSGVCTQLEYFPNNSCDVYGARAANPCSSTCSSDSQCGAGTCAGGTNSPATVCSGNRGSAPWWCQGYNCGYNCNASYQCEQAQVGGGVRGPLSDCQQHCVAPTAAPTSSSATSPPATPPPAPNVTCTASVGSITNPCSCTGTGCSGGTDWSCCHRTCQSGSCITIGGSGGNSCDYSSQCTQPTSCTGVCNAGSTPTYSISGCSGYSHAGYSDGTDAWNEDVPFAGGSHAVTAGKSFSWWVNTSSGTQTGSGICYASAGASGCIYDSDCSNGYYCQ